MMKNIENSPQKNQLNWNKIDHQMEGLAPAMIQDSRTRELLMLGYMNREAYEVTRRTGKVTFYSRSRQVLWQKGETSGNEFQVLEMFPDCDGDSILVLVHPTGPACHRNTRTCFDSMTGANPSGAVESLSFLRTLDETIQDRFASHSTRASGSYVGQLIEEGLDRVVQKVGEEAIETVIAAKNSDLNSLEGEAADLIFHLMVLLRFKGSNLGQVSDVLARRHPSG